MRIIIELSAEESAAREKWQAQSERNADNVDVYDLRWIEIAVGLAGRLRLALDRNRSRARWAHHQECEGVDLCYRAKDRRLPMEYRYTIVGVER